MNTPSASPSGFAVSTRSRIPACSWLLLALVATGSAVTAGADAEQEGRALAEELRAQRPTQDAHFEGVLRIRDHTGNLNRVPIRLDVIAGGADWRSIYEAYTPEHAILERLTVVHGDGRSNQYWLARAGAAGQRLGEPRCLSGEQATNAFAASDFSLADLGLDFFHWPDQRVVKHEMRKGRACQVLESANPHPAGGGYGRVLAWIDVENSGLVRAEAYDRQNRLVKEFAVDKLRKVNGRWELKEVEIRNVQTDSRTHLIYDTGASAGNRPGP